MFTEPFKKSACLQTNETKYRLRTATYGKHKKKKNFFTYTPLRYGAYVETFIGSTVPTPGCASQPPVTQAHTPLRF